MTWCDVWLWWRFTVVLQACLLPGMFAAAHRASLSVPIESVCAGDTVLTLDPATGSMIEAEVLAAGATRAADLVNVLLFYHALGSNDDSEEPE